MDVEFQTSQKDQAYNLRLSEGSAFIGEALVDDLPKGSDLRSFQFNRKGIRNFIKTMAFVCDLSLTLVPDPIPTTLVSGITVYESQMRKGLTFDLHVEEDDKVKIIPGKLVVIK